MENTAQKKSKLESLVTPEFRMSFPYLFTPQLPMGETDEKRAKYSVTMLFPPGTDLAPLKKLAINAGVAKWGPDQTKWPKFKHPLFRSGGEESKKDAPGYGPGVVFCTAKSGAYSRTKGTKNAAPGVIGPDRQIITDPAEIYGGCYGHAKINAFTYSHPVGGSGIAFGLISVMKTRDGEPFGSKNKPENDFDGIAAPAVAPLATAAVGGIGGGLDEGGLGL